MPSDGKDLSVVLEAQERRDLAPDVSSQVIKEMKNSLIFQNNWEDLLQSAPTSISCMGACFAASSSPKAVVKLTPPEKGWQYLRYSSLQANLIECGNLGRYAFIEAESGMGLIQHTSTVISGKVNDVLACLSEPAAAKKLLKPQLSTIKNSATICYDTAVKLDKKFEEWLFYACEMHAACVEQENSTRDILLSNQVCLAAEQTRLDYQQTAVQEAEKASGLLEKQVGLASDAFKKASDEFPTGWDLMGQQIVGDLATCLTTALNQAIPVLVQSMSPMAEAKVGTDLVGGFLNVLEPPKGPAGAAATAPTTNGGPAPASAVPPSPLPTHAADPAYAEVLKSTTYLAGINSIVAGKDGNIDWDMAKGNSTTEGAKTSIKFFSIMLGDAKSRFDPVATTAEPSLMLTKVLQVCSQVVDEISAAVDSSANAKQSYPEKDSDQVKKWQSDFAAQYQNSVTLASVARSLPGSAAGGVPLMASVDPAAQTAAVNAKTAQAQAVLEAGKNRLTTTQQMLTTSQDNYIKATDLLVAQQNKLGEIQANLSRLTASNLTLEEIKSILIECIKLIINLKEQITNLVRFFKAIASIVEICVKLQVEPFLETVKAIVAADGTDPNRDLKIGDYTITDFERTQVYGAVITLRSYFGVFSDIAKMWNELSKHHIMPGLKMCDELAVTADEDSGQMIKKVKVLEEWAQKASDAVAKIAREEQRQIIDGMENRVLEIKQTTLRIEAPVESTFKAITEGTETTKDAAQTSMVKTSEKSSLNQRWVIEDD